jgi:signal transduction histidine kinase
MAPLAKLRPDQPPRREPGMDDDKRSFLRMVSHELRTPLNSILGFSEILSQELYGPLGAPQYREYAEIIQGSGQKLLKLVNQVLEIVRLEGRTADLESRAEPLDLAIEDVLTALRGEISARKMTVEVADPDDLPTVMADPRGLRTVLSNLIQNAVSFAHEGGTVRISAKTVGENVEIVIRDDGPGIEPADLPRLMNPFEQGDGALTRRREGTGLGLPIAELTCRAMGGRLALASKPGKGVTAGITLPAAG